MRIRFGTEGFRGVIGKEFTFDVIRHLAGAYGLFLQERGETRVVVGHDTRFMAETFGRAFAAHLSGMGLEVFLLKGPVPTPLLFGIWKLGEGSWSRPAITPLSI